MKPRTDLSLALYEILKKRGLAPELCELITLNLNTDWTAGRMIGYLSNFPKLSTEEIVDEMFAILSDRERIMKKIETEEANAVYNEYLRNRD